MAICRNFEGGGEVSNGRELKQGIQKDVEGKRTGDVAQDSARQVPTGPDPLHHKHNPSRPRSLFRSPTHA
ncbi:hypothetical protein NMG60_11033794 [Bertholletia excelsa]